MEKSKYEDLLRTLEKRFEANRRRHAELIWETFVKKLDKLPARLKTINEMEITGGEPDVIGFDVKTGEYLICDCSAETPAGRRGLCYDQEALDSRKANKPRGSVIAVAESMGIKLLTELEYRKLQELGEFDRKTSSWIETPATIRALGGALFCDRRYGQVFVYHNGAESYYSSRGFRGSLRV